MTLMMELPLRNTTRYQAEIGSLSTRLTVFFDCRLTEISFNEKVVI